MQEMGIWWDGNRIIIPVFDPSGKHIFNKYRRSPFTESGPKYQYDAGASSALYGAHLIRHTNVVVITEGELDVLALRSAFFPAVSSTGGAGTFDPRWAELLVGKRVIICYDNDTAGYKGALNVQSILPEAKIALLPDFRGIKDVTDYLVWLKNNGQTPTELARVLDAAMTFPMEEYTNESGTKKEWKTIQKKYEERIMWARTIRAQQTAKFLSTGFIDLYIKMQQDLIVDVRQAMKPKAKISPLREKSISAAKQVKIYNYLKFNGQGFTKCLWHDEDTPSLHYIHKTNKVYCFGACQKSFDVIDVVMQQRGIGFSDAMNAILDGT